MARCIDPGVGTSVPDRPERLVTRLAERAEMSPGERLLPRLHIWHRR